MVNEERANSFYMVEVRRGGTTNEHRINVNDMKRVSYDKITLEGTVLTTFRQHLTQKSDEMRRAAMTLRTRFLEKRLKLAKYYGLLKEGKPQTISPRSRKTSKKAKKLLTGNAESQRRYERRGRNV